MPSLKSIKKRIGSVKNTQKITKAMKMVAAAKLRRAQNATLGARHYIEGIRKLAERLSLQSGGAPHSLTVSQTVVKRRKYVLFTSDRGLCGGFNSNLLRRFAEVMQDCRQKKIEFGCDVIGKKGRDYFKSKSWVSQKVRIGIYDNLDRKLFEEISNELINEFERKEWDEIWIGYNQFKSMISQEVTFQKLLPIEVEQKNQTQKAKGIDYIFEPSCQDVLDKILRESIVSQVQQACMESLTSELAARMAAMDNATKNASDMIGYLTLQYNRARQATITKELMDIVNGAEALN